MKTYRVVITQIQTYEIEIKAKTARRAEIVAYAKFSTMTPNDCASLDGSVQQTELDSFEIPADEIAARVVINNPKMLHDALENTSELESN